MAANGTENKTYGTHHLGIDFLCDNRLLVDLGGQCLIHSATYADISAPSIVCLSVPLAVTKPVQVNSVYANLLTSKSILIELTFHKDKVPHKVKLCIDTGQFSPLHSASSVFVPQQTRCRQGCVQKDGGPWDFPAFLQSMGIPTKICTQAWW